MPRKDPEGTEVRSRQEYKDLLAESHRKLEGLPKPKNDNPEGVPAGDR